MKSLAQTLGQEYIDLRAPHIQTNKITEKFQKIIQNHTKYQKTLTINTEKMIERANQNTLTNLTPPST